jgi:predicted nucleic acid-binding protein
MQIVSDASPLIILKKSEAIQILEKQFTEVIITKKIRDELFIKERAFFEDTKILKLVEVTNHDLVSVLSLIVDEGEAGVIALALERNSTLLIDDLKGRRLADNLGINYIGTLGILKVAKNKGLIREVRPILDKFLEKGYHLDTRLIEKYLEELGEL